MCFSPQSRQLLSVSDDRKHNLRLMKQVGRRSQQTIDIIREANRSRE